MSHLKPNMIKFAKKYVECACDVKKAADALNINYNTAYGWTKNKAVCELIELHQKTVSRQLEDPRAGGRTLYDKHASDKSFYWKVEKLKMGVNLALPDNPLSILEVDIKAGVACISELNKMEGHYAAEKMINLNLTKSVDDPDVANAKQIFEEMLNRNRKDY